MAAATTDQIGPPMTHPIRVALVGYGLAGKTFHAPLIAVTEGLTLATIVSSDRAKVHADFPDVQVFDSLGAALADDAIDLVVIATPDHLHAEQALAALEAGKHVVIDKPFAPTLAEALAISEQAIASDRVVSIFQNRRWDADFLTVQRLLAENALGVIVEFASHFDRFRPSVTHRWKDQRVGGVWQDLGPHLVDQAVLLFGMPKAVYADIATQKTGGAAPDFAHVLLRYDRLRVTIHISQLNAANGVRFAVHGTGGSFIKHGLDPQEDQSKAGLSSSDADWGVDHRPGIMTFMGTDDMLHETSVVSERGNYRAFYEAVRDAISGQGPNPVPPAQALNVMRVIEAGLQSARGGRDVILV
jgi:predicted dehydrogenase